MRYSKSQNFEFLRQKKKLCQILRQIQLSTLMGLYFCSGEHIMQKYKFCSKISTKYRKTDISVKIKISVIGIEKKNLSINIDYRYRKKKFQKIYRYRYRKKILISGQLYNNGR